MKFDSSALNPVPTNIITGFLGVGKTTTILNLLKYKPEGERWALLVNEFGEIGIDSSLIQGHAEAGREVFIREVPGGCMCCAAGLPMQMALSQLLSTCKPHRLLIEPTGLGHPLEVLQVLSAPHNRDYLSIQKILTLVDARHLSSNRYSENQTFIQQLQIADLVVANKDDLSSTENRSTLQFCISDLCQPGTEIIYTRYGQLDLNLLAGPTATAIKEPLSIENRSTDNQSPAPEEIPIPESGYVMAVKSGADFNSIGWRFSPFSLFDRKRLLDFFNRLNVERLKAVFITPEGVLGYNMTSDALTEVELDDCVESRIEIIACRINHEWLNDLTDCIVEVE